MLVMKILLYLQHIFKVTILVSAYGIPLLARIEKFPESSHLREGR